MWVSRRKLVVPQQNLYYSSEGNGMLCWGKLGYFITTEGVQGSLCLLGFPRSFNADCPGQARKQDLSFWRIYTIFLTIFQHFYW